MVQKCVELDLENAQPPATASDLAASKTSKKYLGEK